MLVEITGLPGSGKTALAHELSRTMGGVVGRVTKKREAIYWGLRFALRHPIIYFMMCVRALAVFVSSPRYGVYIFRVLTVMSANTMYARSLARTRLVFLDEGVTQFLLSEARTTRTRQYFVRRLKRLPDGQFLMHLVTKSIDRQERLARRPQGVPRYIFESDTDEYILSQEKNGAAFGSAVTTVRGERAAVLLGQITLAETGRTAVREYESRLRGSIAVVIPEYRAYIANHFAHTLELFRDAGRHIGLSLGVERGELPEGLSGTMIGGGFILRFFRTKLWMLRERRRGVSVLYVHYSFVAAFIGSFIFPRVYLWNCGEAWKYPKSFLFEWAIRKVMRRVHVVTGTAGLAEEYVRIYGLDKKRVHVMPNSISLERFTAQDKSAAREVWGIPAGARVITFLHHLSPRKGAHHIAPILEGLAHDGSVHVLIAGEGPFEDELVQQIAKWNWVHKLGSVPNADVPSLLAATDVLMMPSEEEGFPRVLLEAMAMGIPFVASDVGGVRDIVPKEMHEFLVPVGDENLFRTKLMELLEKDNAEVGESLRAWVRQFDLPLVRERFLRLIAGE